MKQIAAVVVTFNRKELLKECIEALLNQTRQVIDILVIDNASTDGTKEYIDDLLNDDNVFYINTGSNLGGAGGFSFGLKEAYNRGYDYMWIMDDDTIVKPNTLEEFIKADKKLDGKYGFLTSCVLWTDDSYCTMNRPLVDLDNWIADYKMVEEGLVRVCKATFVSLFLKRQIIERVGLPLKEYFIWGDDMEYTLRISRRFRSYYVSDAKVVHKMKNNVGSDISIDDEERIPRYKMAFRNDCHTAWINGPMYILNYYLLVLYMFKKIICSKAPKKLLRFKTLILGSLSGLIFHPKVEYVDSTKKKKK